MAEGMTPHDAALQAMREVSGPVVAIAIILAASSFHRVHPGHHRQVVPAIRGDHRHLGDHLGVQRAIAQPALAACCSGRRPGARPVGMVFR